MSLRKKFLNYEDAADFAKKTAIKHGLAIKVSE